MPRDTASITTDALLEALADQGVLDEQKIISLFGADRHDMSLDKLEVTIVQNSVLSNTRLLMLKGMLSGLPVLDDPSLDVLPMIPPALAKQTGALVVDRPEPTVAFVEDLPNNVERVAQQLGRHDFAVWLMTAPQFVELFRATYQGHKTDHRAPVTDIFEIFDECVSREASDIHLSVGLPPVLRVDGQLVRMNRQPLDQAWMEEQIGALLGAEALDEAKTVYNRDAGFTYGNVRFRINVGADAYGLTLAIRRLPNKIPNFDDLGLPLAVRRFTELERGLVLVTGPTGSGKSTTLAALLSHIALTQSRHLLTLEDPIEFVLPSRASVVHQRELGQSFTSFADGLRQSLRQDPDVVLVGEARDPETIRAAVTAAETGALVFATMHTYDAASTLGRIVSSYPEGEQDQVRNQVAYVLKGVVSQTLVPAINGGRVAALEVLVSTPGVVNNLRKPEGLLQIRQVLSTGMQHGMQTMEFHLADLVKRGVIRESEAEYKARDLDEFRRHMAHNASVSGH